MVKTVSTQSSSQQPRGTGALALIVHKVITDVKRIVILFGTMIHLGTKNKNLFSLHPLAYYTEKIVLVIFRGRLILSHCHVVYSQISLRRPMVK